METGRWSAQCEFFFGQSWTFFSFSSPALVDVHAVTMHSNCSNFNAGRARAHTHTGTNTGK